MYCVIFCLLYYFFFFFFFFKQKTAYEMRISDWSSDVCSSDLRYHNTDEECWIMGVELIVDVALPAESSDEDETGVGILTVACNQAFKALSVVGIGLVEGAQICDDVVEIGRAHV